MAYAGEKLLLPGFFTTLDADGPLPFYFLFFKTVNGYFDLCYNEINPKRSVSYSEEKKIPRTFMGGDHPGDPASKHNFLLTPEYMLTSVRINSLTVRRRKFARRILLRSFLPFSNAEGGTVVLGISGKTRKLEGVNFVGGR